MLGLTEGSRFSYVSAVLRCSFLLQYMRGKKSKLIQLYNWKREEYFRRFWAQLWYCFLIRHQNASDSLLKVSCNVEFTMVSSLTLKSTELREEKKGKKSITFSCSFNGTYTHVWFLTSCVGHLKDTDLLSCTDPPNVNTFQ